MPRDRGIWAISDTGISIVDPDGPATILVPGESVRLLAVDLPLASRAKRREALPFAIEDRIADSPDRVHLALGVEVAPKCYLVGVVAHDRMEAWIAITEAAGLGHAAMVPDMLALPVPQKEQWAVEVAGARALVRTGDGAGFALPAAMLEGAWRRAGEPAVIGYGTPLPEAMGAARAPGDIARELARPALDLRQGIYARRGSRSTSGAGRRLGWILGIGLAAHATIAAADTMMLRTIADRREAEVRTLAAQMAPGAALDGDPRDSVPEMLPAPAGNDRFLPLLDRISTALGPVAPAIAMHSIAYRANAMTLDMGTLEPDAVPRIRAALADAAIDASVTNAPDGSIRVEAKLP